MLATCTAVVSGYLAYCRWREKRPDLTVRISTGVQYGTEYIFVKASNAGERTVVISSKGLLLPEHKKRFMPRDYGADFTEPWELLVEHRCGWQVSKKSLAGELRSMGLSGQVQLVGLYEDLVGRTYESRPFEFDVDDWV